MPRGDKTGPNGAGPRTGRGLGFCTGHNQAGYLTDTAGYGRGRGFGGGRGFGRGNGFGRGMGFGFRHGYRHFYEDDGISEKTLIENEINTLKDKLNSLEEKLKNLNN